MANETKTTKVNHTKLDLTKDAVKHLDTIRTFCRTWRYDIKKIMEVLNCPYYQAHTLISLAQIEDAKPAAVPATPAAKTAKA